jgi:hypothetical protein
MRGGKSKADGQLVWNQRRRIYGPLDLIFLKVFHHKRQPQTDTKTCINNPGASNLPNMVAIWRRATVVKAIDPRDDKQFPEGFRQQGWLERLKVDITLLAGLPDNTRKYVEGSEFTTDAIFKRIVGEGEITIGSENFGFVRVFKQLESKAWFWALLAFLQVWYFWPSAAALLTLPDLSLGLIGERIYNLKSIPAKVFTLVQLVPMVFFKFLDFGMCLQLVRERMVGPASTSFGFAPLAFNKNLRYLYDSQPYISGVGAAGIGLQILIQFSERLVHRFWKTHWIGREQQSDLDAIRATVAEITRLRGELASFTTWLSAQSISDTMQHRMSVTKDDIARKIDFLVQSLPKQNRPHVPVYTPGPKRSYMFSNALVLFGNSLFYLGAWGTFLQALGYAVVIEITTVLKVGEPQQSLDDIKQFSDKTVSNIVGQIVLVSIPYRIGLSIGFNVAEHWLSFSILMGLQLFYVLVLTSLVIPLLIRFGEWCGNTIVNWFH